MIHIWVFSFSHFKAFMKAQDGHDDNECFERLHEPSQRQNFSSKFANSFDEITCVMYLDKIVNFCAFVVDFTDGRTP